MRFVVPDFQLIAMLLQLSLSPSFPYHNIEDGKNNILYMKHLLMFKLLRALY